jgi:TRAP-type C4-dicarboxylate transport system substrate-binding protein
MKNFLGLVAATALAVSFWQPGFAQEFKWTMGSQVGATHIGTQMLEDYADRVKERSNGRIEIKVVAIGTMGFNRVDALRMMKDRVMESMHIYPYMMARDEPMLTMFVPHGGLFNKEDNLKIGDLQFEIATEIYEKWDLVAVAQTGFGLDPDTVMGVVTRDPIGSIDDLKSIKLRHGEPIGLAAWKKLGISAQGGPPFSELYVALRTGVVDGTTLSAQYIKSTSLYEVTCCFSEIMNITIAAPNVITVHKDEWAKVPADLQKVLRDVGSEIYEESLAGWRLGKAENAAFEFLKSKGMQVLPPFPSEDRKKIANALIEVWLERCSDLGQDTRNTCNRIASLIQQ